METRDADRAGQSLIIGLPGPELDGEARDLLREVRPAGVILFRRNLGEPGQIAGLTRAIRAAVSPSPFLAVDQEGGRVSRLTPPFPPLPPAARLGRLDLASVSRWFGALTGRGLRSLGFHLDFAPVVDLSRAGDEDGIGDRAFSNDPRQAASRAGEFLRGLAEARVAGCLKHFPGLGGAPGDTHLCLPRMETDAAGLERALTPYRLLVAEAPMVMVAHAWYPLLSGNDPAPASLDRRIVTGLLRDELGWQGITLCDDLEMGAVCPPANGDAGAPRPFGDLAVAALAAGNDQVLVCQSAERVADAHAAIRRAMASGDLDPAQSQASLERIRRLKSGPACARPDEPFDPGELDLVVDEMKTLIGEVDSALRRRGE